MKLFFQIALDNQDFRRVMKLKLKILDTEWLDQNCDCFT
jgi:hypothetical protein